MDEKEPNVQVIGGKGGKGGRGGNVILSSGALGEVFDIVVKKLREGLEEYGGNTLIAGGVGNGQPAGDIIFNAGNLEVLRIDPKGDFFYKGEKLDHNEDVAFVLRAWLGYCVIAMKENRERFKGEERIGELEAQLREANKVAERAQFVEKGKLRADTNLEAWRKWASETLGKYPGLGEADSTLREGVTKHIAYLRKGGAKILQEAGFVSMKDEDVPELFAAGQRARALEDDLSAWREWACLQSGMTYVGEADSWLRVRVQDALKTTFPRLTAADVDLVERARGAFHGAASISLREMVHLFQRLFPDALAPEMYREPNAVMPKEWGAVEPLSGKEIFAIRHDLMKRGLLP